MAVAAGGALVPPWLETRYGVWYFVVSEEAWGGREDEMPTQTATHSSQLAARSPKLWLEYLLLRRMHSVLQFRLYYLAGLSTWVLE